MTDPREKTEQPDIVERLRQHDLNLCPDWRDETDCRAWIDLADALMSDSATEIERLRLELAEARERLAAYEPEDDDGELPDIPLSEFVGKSLLTIEDTPFLSAARALAAGKEG